MSNAHLAGAAFDIELFVLLVLPDEPEAPDLLGIQRTAHLVGKDDAVDGAELAGRGHPPQIRFNLYHKPVFHCANLFPLPAGQPPELARLRLEHLGVGRIDRHGAEHDGEDVDRDDHQAGQQDQRQISAIA